MCTDRGPGNAQRPAAEGVTAERRRRSAFPKSPPFIVGVVGPAGSGKSTLARALEGPGTRLLDADRFGHEVTDREPAVRAALIADYGPEVYRADGALDRARVAARVFGDPRALAKLNALVHPHILSRLRSGIAGASGLDTVVVDAALLLDWAFERECDAVIAVVAPRLLQLERLRTSRGWSEDEARRRLANARSNEQFAGLADEVVVNDGDEAAGVRAMRAAVARLRSRWAAA